MPKKLRGSGRGIGTYNFMAFDNISVNGVYIIVLHDNGEKKMKLFIDVRSIRIGM
jgi:hypothetical protein